MKTKNFNVCFTMYCNETVQSDTPQQAIQHIKDKYQNAFVKDFVVGSQVDIDMVAQLDKDGGILQGKLFI